MILSLFIYEECIDNETKLFLPVVMDDEDGRCLLDVIW